MLPGPEQSPTEVSGDRRHHPRFRQDGSGVAEAATMSWLPPSQTCKPVSSPDAIFCRQDIIGCCAATSHDNMLGFLRLVDARVQLAR